MSAWFMDAGSLRMCFKNSVLKAAFNRDGEPIHHPWHESGFFYTAPRVVTANYASGKLIPDSELRDLLAAQKLVIVSMDARPVDPMYLQLLKEDTIVLRVDDVRMLHRIATPKKEASLTGQGVTK